MLMVKSIKFKVLEGTGVQQKKVKNVKEKL